MTYELKAVPKPVRAKRTRAPLRNRKPLKRTKMRCGAGSKRRGKSSFPKQRDKKYTAWLVTENACLLAGRAIKVPLSSFDIPVTGADWVHRCWGPIDPAHVDEHRARGAPDFAQTAPLCRAAHSFYDERRKLFAQVTGFSERKMASAASGYALKYVESGGSSTPHT